MSIYVNDEGNLRKITETYVNDAGTLRKLKSFEVNDNGTLRSIPFERVEGTLIPARMSEYGAFREVIGYDSTVSVPYGVFTTPNNKKLVNVPEFGAVTVLQTWNSTGNPWGAMTFTWTSNPMSDGRPYPIKRIEIEGNFGSGNETVSHSFDANPANLVNGFIFYDKHFIPGNTYKVRAILR